MKMIDLKCPHCQAVSIDVLIRDENPELPLCEAPTEAGGVCDTRMVRVHLGHAAGVIADDIPGGVEIRHGLCNPDGSPRRYYSRTEIAKEAIRRGQTNYVVHQGTKGGDKNKNTVRWT